MSRMKTKSHFHCERVNYKRCTGSIKGSGARYNDFNHTVRWINCKLEFQSTVVHVSSPV